MCFVFDIAARAESFTSASLVRDGVQRAQYSWCTSCVLKFRSTPSESHRLLTYCERRSLSYERRSLLYVVKGIFFLFYFLYILKVAARKETGADDKLTGSILVVNKISTGYITLLKHITRESFF